MFKSKKLDEIVESIGCLQAQIAQNRGRIRELERLCERVTKLESFERKFMDWVRANGWTEE